MSHATALGPNKGGLINDGLVRQSQRRLQSVKVALHFVTHDGVPDPPAGSVLDGHRSRWISNNNTRVSELIQVRFHRRATEPRTFRDFRSRRRPMLCQVPQDGNLCVVAAEHVNGCLYRGRRVRTDVSGHGIYLAAPPQDRSHSELSA